MSRSFAMAIFASATVLSSGTSDAASVHWKKSLGGNNNFYEVIVDALTWTEARDKALAMNNKRSDLASLTSLAENNFVTALLEKSGAFAGWVGGLQAPGSIEPNQGWSWVTGEKFEFTNWFPGEPNNCCGGEDFIELQPNGYWNDVGFFNDVQQTRPAYIVEIAPITVPAGLVLSIPAFAALALFGRGRRKAADRSC